MIELRNLSKSFTTADGPVDALRNVCLTINDGDIYGIIGMSGAGKSTLVRCINMLERPTDGAVLLDGRDLGALSKKELRHVRQRVTMIFQGFNLLMQRNCVHNIMLPLKLSGKIRHQVLDPLTDEVKQKADAKVARLQEQFAASKQARAEKRAAKAERRAEIRAKDQEAAKTGSLGKKAVCVLRPALWALDTAWEKVLRAPVVGLGRLARVAVPRVGQFFRCSIVLPMQKGREISRMEKARALELLKIVDLPDKARSFPAQLSGGQQQRIAIARALATSPDVLLCDEATSALDPKTTHAILELIRDINAKLGITVIVITHQMNVVQEICNRVAILEHGAVVEEGEVAQVFANPQAEVTRNLVYPEMADATDTLGDKHGQRVRIIFNGAPAAKKPLIASMAMDVGVAASILGASTRSVGDRAYGYILLEIPGGPEELARAVNYLKAMPDVTVQVEVDYPQQAAPVQAAEEAAEQESLPVLEPLVQEAAPEAKEEEAMML